MNEKKFLLKKLFGKMLNRKEVDERCVTLEIETEQPLPDKFYEELAELIKKYC